MNRFSLFFSAIALGLASTVQASDNVGCSKVTLADSSATDITMSTAVARLLLSELGYHPSVKRLTLAQTYRNMAEGQVDVFLGNWMPAQQALIRPYSDGGQVEVVQTNLANVRHTLAVLNSGHQQGLKDFTDIQRFKTQLDGQIFGLEPGHVGNETIKAMIRQNAFGLGDFKLVESNEQGMLRQATHAQRQGRPAVFLAWMPHPMNDALELQYLSGGDQYFGPNFGASKVNTVTRKGLARECPNLAKLLNNLTFTAADSNQLMSAYLAGNTNRRRVAKQWIQSNPNTVSRWLAGVRTLEGQPASTSVLFQTAQAY